MQEFTRETGEGVLVGRDIKVTVIAVRGDEVTLRVDTPESLLVFPQEVIEKLNSAARQAISGNPGESPRA